MEHSSVQNKKIRTDKYEKTKKCERIINVNDKKIFVLTTNEPSVACIALLLGNDNRSQVENSFFNKHDSKVAQITI